MKDKGKNILWWRKSEYVQNNIRPSLMTLLTTMSLPSSGPSPISWPPSGQWYDITFFFPSNVFFSPKVVTNSAITSRDGDDGKWSSFALRVGNPQQTVRVLISTASVCTWVILPGGCPPGAPGLEHDHTCTQSRGGTFAPSRSSSWREVGNYSLNLELNLGYNDPGTYGLDTVALGVNNFPEAPTMNAQVVAGLETYDFYIGMFGLRHQSANFTNSSDPYNLSGDTTYPSFLETLKASSLIPSLSWAYTAGAPYRM